eukprot:764635-Hanusia_phi.AAC.10
MKGRETGEERRGEWIWIRIRMRASRRRMGCARKKRKGRVGKKKLTTGHPEAFVQVRRRREGGGGRGVVVVDEEEEEEEEERKDVRCDVTCRGHVGRDSPPGE